MCIARLLLITAMVMSLLCPAFAAGDMGDVPDDPGKKYDNIYTKERFDGADVDGDGYVTFQEAQDAAYSFEGSKGRNRFDRADTDGDGKLTFDEARAYKAWERQKGKDKKAGESPDAGGAMEKDVEWKLRKDEGNEEGWRKETYKGQMYTKERFDSADADGDGFLSWSEAQASSNAFEGEKGRKRFEKTDSNGDGKVSLQEAQTQKAWEIEHRWELHDKKFGEDEEEDETHDKTDR